MGFMRRTGMIHTVWTVWYKYHMMTCWCAVTFLKKCNIVLSGSYGIRFQRRLEESNGHDRSKLSQSWLLRLNKSDWKTNGNIIYVRSKIDQPQNSSSYQANMYSKCLINSSKFISSSLFWSGSKLFQCEKKGLKMK